MEAQVCSEHVRLLILFSLYDTGPRAVLPVVLGTSPMQGPSKSWTDWKDKN